MEWLIHVEKETGRKLLMFQSDGGGEYISKGWIQYVKDQGICFEKPSSYTPEQNGDAERQNRTVFDRVQTILINADLPLFLWIKAVNYIVYTANPHMSLPAQHLLRSTMSRNWTSQKQFLLVVELTSTIIHFI